MTFRSIVLMAGVPLAAALGFVNQSFQATFAFVLLLGVLITIHEFGHFAVAKLCGVKVLKFSIGFGTPIGFGKYRLLWKRGETEYVVAWFPIGGFVKMLGENPDEEEGEEALADPERALSNKPMWQKLAVVAAGPVMNLIFPIFILVGILAMGIPQRVAIVGNVEAGSPAAEAGVLAGDRILSVDGEPVAWWDDALGAVRERPGGLVELTVERAEAQQTLRVSVEGRSGLDPFNAHKELGWIGLDHARPLTYLSVAEGSLAQRAGLRSGDRVLAVDGREVANWQEWAEAYAAGPRGSTVTLRVLGQGEDEASARELGVQSLGSMAELGVEPALLRIGQVTPDSAAGEAGIQAGDLLLSVDGKPLAGFAAFRDRVLESEGQPLEIRYARGGETLSASVAPRMTEAELIDGVVEKIYLIGISGQDEVVAGALAQEVIRNPFESIPRATMMTVDITRAFMVGLGKLVSGEIPSNQLGGPLRIAEEAHKAFQSGWERYLHLMILISINLGILNLLPIPVLDGGQALIFTAEGILRSPLSPRIKEGLQGAGLAMLALLMGFAFWNDFVRYGGMIIDLLRGST